MLYKQSYNTPFSPELFENPTSEYRAAPFWSWNCKLDTKELREQIKNLQEMKFGGFFMHVRTGMDTPYPVSYTHLAAGRRKRLPGGTKVLPPE